MVCKKMYHHTGKEINTIISLHVSGLVHLLSMHLKLGLKLVHTKIVIEYGQEIPQIQTAGKPMAPRGRATRQSRDTRKKNLAKQLALPNIKMIAKLKWTFVCLI